MTVELLPGETKTYSYSESCKKIILGKGSYFFEVWGAQGGNRDGIGGYGGYSSGYAQFTKRVTIYACIGGEGQFSNSNPRGGTNGGGSGKIGSSNDYCGGGGGATDFRFFKDDANTRFIVAGGGGGGNNDKGIGGEGGGLEGLNGYFKGEDVIGKGGTQEKGGEKAHYKYEGTDYYSGEGQFSSGGNGEGVGYSGGGGGGGYYGGSGGYESGGGGGSGFLSPTIFHGITIAGNETIPQVDGSLRKGRTGNGAARITMLYHDICFTAFQNKRRKRCISLYFLVIAIIHSTK